MGPFGRLILTLGAVVWFGTHTPSGAAPGYSVEIDLGEQRAYLLYEGRLRFESPISSGRSDYPTPTGRFKILNKNISHLSSLYGKIIDARGRTVVADADSDMAVPPGGKFVNAPMPYFMRFHGGVGMHAGYLPGYAASHGCVRLPKENAVQFFRAVDIGTPVTVFGRAPGRRQRAVQDRENEDWQEPQRQLRERTERRVILRRFRPWVWD